MNKQEVIYQRLKAALSPDTLQVIDESDQHIGHAGHQGGGRHFAVIISGGALIGLSRVEAHRKIYAELADLMPEAVHALRIVIK